MAQIEVVNIKCQGCEKSIISALEKIGYSNVKVDISNQTVSFDQKDSSKAISMLSKMGYPEKNSPEAKEFLKKAKSFASCMIGRLKK
ncbi:MAG TPA: cation transporter [Candidatus Pacearchaeota archaeon]|nr:cation transporter [Candidatus Pacearchaeota archaeon]HPM08466.1 cation transporter [Candidatus Pacearchaeota archaeon]HQI74759.1 cation transporter [Candidatus Pacearchaeota archaeon]